jgi:flagellar biosynthetic protein FliP
MKYIFHILLGTTIFLFAGSNFASAQSLTALGLPALTASDIDGGGTTYSLSLQILLLMTIMTVLPSLVWG